MKNFYFTFLLLWSLPLCAQIQFEYNTYSSDDSKIDEQFGTNPLENGKEYQMEVTGTYSIWSAYYWTSPCGWVEDAPQFPSPNVTYNGHVGFDFEYTFSQPKRSFCRRQEPPFLPEQPRMEISLDNGVTWFHPVTTDHYNSEHRYTYTVTGAGYPLGVRHISTQNSDDYGILKFKLIEEQTNDNGSGDTLVIPTEDTLATDLEDSIALIAFEMPNVFTPGGDGSSDLFVPKKWKGMQHGQLEVYNRWGQVMHSGPVEEGWNGTYNKRPCAADVYYWLVEYTDVYGNTKKEKGSVTLLR